MAYFQLVCFRERETNNDQTGYVFLHSVPVRKQIKGEWHGAQIDLSGSLSVHEPRK